MFDPRAVGVREFMLVTAAVLASSCCNDFYTVDSDGPLPPPPDAGEGICLTANPNASSPTADQCYAKRLLIQSMPLQLGVSDSVRVDARVVGVMFTYGTDSLFVVPEDSEHHTQPTLEWRTYGGLDTARLTDTTSALLVERSGNPPLNTSETDSLIPTPEHSTILRSGYWQDRLGVIDPDSPGTPTFVVVEAPFDQAGRSNISLVRAKGAKQCEETRLLAFATRGVLTENLLDTCKLAGGKVDTVDVALFPGSGIAGRKILLEKDLPDTVSFPVVPPASGAPILTQISSESLTIRVIVWLEPGSETEDLLSDIDTWLTIANTVLSINRTGLQIDLDWRKKKQQLGSALQLGDKGDLSAICDTLKASDFTRPAKVNVTKGVNLFIADAVGNDNGYSCKSPNGVVILGRGAGALTFVHELGHTLGLRPWGAPNNDDPGFPWTGHTNKNPDILRNNVMWSRPNDGGSGHRNEFTLGQIYRMNFDDRSWIDTAAVLDGSENAKRPMVRCQDSATVSWPCPRLDLDIAELLRHPVGDSSK